MLSKAGTGVSRHADAFTAGAEAMMKAREAGGGGNAVVGIMYGTVAYDQSALVEGARSVLGDVPLVGCSSQGVALEGLAEESDRLVGATVIHSSQIRAHVARVSGVGKNSVEAGEQLAKLLSDQLGAEKGNDPLFLWYDPLTGCNTEYLLSGLATKGFNVVVGGAAGQTWGPMHRTYQYFNDEALSDCAVALRFSGLKEIVYDMTHGTEPLGLELTITEAQDNVIKTINGEPALDVWASMLGGGTSGNVDDTANWAVGVTLPPTLRDVYEGPITRAVFGFKKETKEVLLQAPITSGTTVQLCHRTPEAVFDRALEMAKRMRGRLEGKKPLMALAFECGARPSPFLGREKALEEVQELQSILGEHLPWLGMYAWGEIAPVGDVSRFHNYTFPLCILCE